MNPLAIVVILTPDETGGNARLMVQWPPELDAERLPAILQAAAKYVEQKNALVSGGILTARSLAEV